MRGGADRGERLVERSGSRPDRHADINIEINEIAAACAPLLDRLTCPVRYVLATDGSLGGGDEEMEAMCASLDPVLARNPNLKVSAKVASNHAQILRKDFRAVADAVRELAAERVVEGAMPRRPSQQRQSIR